MRNLHALRHAGRAGGVDDVGEVLARDLRGQVGVAFRREPRFLRIEDEDLRVGRGQRIAKGALGQQHRRLGVAQHVGLPFLRQVAVDRQIGAAGLHHRQQRDDQRGRARLAKATTLSGPMPSDRSTRASRLARALSSA